MKVPFIAMSRVYLKRIGNDCIVLTIHAQVLRAALWAFLAVVYWFGFYLLEAGKPEMLFWALLGVVLVPVTIIRALRLLARRKYTLVRAHGRLFLDGEPLEMTRLELRIQKIPIIKIPMRYSLSFWAMTASGPMDIPLGSYSTLLSASEASGWVEEFVHRTGNQLHRHA